MPLGAEDPIEEPGVGPTRTRTINEADAVAVAYTTPWGMPSAPRNRSRLVPSRRCYGAVCSLASIDSTKISHGKLAWP